MTREWATRFYGMTVTAEVAAAAVERLTDPSIEDLVDAHLGINYAYFGAIDKTLAGFVVLESAGDDYTVLDVRDGGQVWWQDHETRGVELRHDSLAAFRASSDGQAETPKLAPRSRRRVTTPALCARYQWLVWLLARPPEQGGVAVQAIDDFVRGGIARLRHTWPRRELLEAAFDRELGELAGDPHLAIYWLLHTTAVADHARRARVVDAVDRANDLVRAFVGRLGDLPLAGDVPIVPRFRARRALVQTYGETELAADDVPRACLIALELEPATSSLVHALQVTSGLDRGVLTTDEVTEAMARIPNVTAGTELVRAVLAKRSGATASPHADVLAHLVGVELAAEPRDPWWFALEAMWQTHELAYDGPALYRATQQVLRRDRYHRRALQMAMRAAQIANAGDPVIDALEDSLELADHVIEPFQKLVETPRDWQAIVAALPEPAARALACRVLQRVAVNKPSPELAAWAAQHVVGDPAGVVLVADAFAQMDADTQSGVVGAIARVLDGPDHPLVGILLACIEGAEPAASDYGAQLKIKRAKGAALIALAPWFHTRALFERLIALVERPASGPVVDLFWAKLFSPSEKATYVVPRLDAAQAERAARALIATELRHPSIHARNAAGHQLYRFSHPGAEQLLIDALTEYGVRFAAARGPGGAVLDHGKTENDQLEDVVANLYAAVRGLGTPASREALIERLFAERRAYWRLGSAIGEVWSPEVHTRVLALLAERRDARAAGAYAYALHDFVKRGGPLVDLARLVREWQGDNEVARGFLHYALVVGIEAALAVRDYDLVRLAHENAAWIAEPPIEPDAHTRNRTWLNPLDTENVKAALAAALSGDAARQRTALHEAAVVARAKGKPNLAVTDAELGQLANAQVASRLLHDVKSGEIWFCDSDGAIRYFDGYDAPAAAPFSARLLGFEGAVAELAGAVAIAERALWWDPRAEEFRDAVRIGPHLVVSWGANNGTFAHYLLGFADHASAEAAFAQLRANPAPGYRESEAYYVPGLGAVVRTYSVREGGEPQRHVLAVYDGVFDGTDYGSEAAAIAEHTKREVTWLAAGGVMTCLEWMDSRKRRSDLTVREWIAKRVRDDARSAAWHVEALDEVGRYLATHAIAAPLETELAPPATPADIAAFAAARTQPVPTVLDNLWRAIGGASWQLGERGMRLLSPLEVLARRPVARAAAEAYMAKLSPAAAEQAAPLLRSLDVLVETRDGKPATFVVDGVRADDRVFTHAHDHVNDFWWEKSLGWMFATGLLDDLEEAIATAEPAVERLKYGEKAAAAKKAAPRPAAKQPTANKPAVEKAAAKPPAAKKSGSKPPAAKKPAAKKPAAAKKSAAKKPAAKKSAAKKPAAKKSAAKKPAAKKPAAAKKSAAKKPAAKKSAAKKSAAKHR
ncbi:MAG: histone H1-like repetitive region-containing protein [Kofleriaceae bacterium]